MGVPPTQLTLIARLRSPGDHEAWQRFESLYRELIVRFSIRQGVQPADAEDVAQGVLKSLSSAMPNFRLDPAKGRFRSYLFRAVRHEISRVRTASARPLGGHAALVSDGGAIDGHSERMHGLAPADPLERMFEDEWITHHFRLALAQVRQTFSARSVEMFERLLSGASVESVAASFETTPDAVHKVKQRVRDRMRELVARQIAEES